MHTYLQCVKRITTLSLIFVAIPISAQDLWKSLWANAVPVAEAASYLTLYRERFS